jgi:chemotaxis signal transduction protein
MTTTQSSNRRRATKSIAGRYLVCRLGDRRYAVDVLLVKDILRSVPAHSLCDAYSRFGRPVRTRGHVFSPIDLRTTYSYPPLSPHANVCVIVLDLPSLRNTISLAIVVDGIYETADLTDKQITLLQSIRTRGEWAGVIGFAATDHAKEVCILDARMIAGKPEFASVLAYDSLDATHGDRCEIDSGNWTTRQ